MKQAEQIIRESKEKLQYIFTKLYLYDDEETQRAISANIAYQVELINNAQKIIDKSRTFCEGSLKELIDFTVAWNEKYIPLYTKLIDIYYKELETYQQQMFNTSWKDLDAIERIRSQYRNVMAKTSPTYYEVKGGYDFGDYYCIRDYVIGREQQNAIDYMVRSINSKGIQKVNDAMSKINRYVGHIKAYNLVEDTDGVSGIVVGEKGRVKVITDILNNKMYSYKFVIKSI